ncbi:hypothetical protein GCM10023231_40350 [Olivibacter ginsenosidimutans]|uniref:Uncharacterized protein n=1 Tax=Olivibacter ginsenosidimutans TaxID=1176537 RepID=A0ABP9CD72_9SPHI
MMQRFKKISLIALCLQASACAVQELKEPKQISGIYPHLAMYNKEGECGTGAVVPWQDRLWVITYGPHLPFGSSDKLYEITNDLERTIRTESIGGTPANRMIHRESQQLFIGPYVIDSTRNVRVIPYKTMPGRMTGNARHLTDPAHKIYYGTMEEGFYEVGVDSLDVKTLYVDGNVTRKPGEMVQEASLLPGAHGKGLYSGQGVLVYSNNGEATKEALTKFDVKAGALSEWDGKNWKLVRRNQFTEVTGPGGIYGNEHPESDPIWTNGWDHKSLLLGVRSAGKWSFFRLPKASHSYDGAHGWNTEWPRIRNVGTEAQPDYLMTMHGMFWHFPKGFTSGHTAGIRPRSAYLKVIGDFARWNDRLVFGCDDSAQKEFLNKRKQKGSIEGPGQSNSNLWFTSIDQPDKLGPATADGAVWQHDTVQAGQTSDPFLFAGWPLRSCWLTNEGKTPTTFSLEIDRQGDGQWTSFKTIPVSPGETVNLSFDQQESGEWIRVKTTQQTLASVHFTYGQHDERKGEPDAIFRGLAQASSFNGGLLYGLGNDRKALGVLAQSYEDGQAAATSAYYELNEQLQLIPKTDDSTATFIAKRFAIPKNVLSTDASSVLITDDKGRRWRLPLGDSSLTALNNKGALRVCREVATERDLFNCQGTFYELPAENADGFAKIRPVSSHPFKINDYASYRGMLVMTGIDPKVLAKNKNEHIVVSADNKAAVWLGAIDDLWKMGKPKGEGGPWMNTLVHRNVPSDPYLIGFYDKRKLTLSHQAAAKVTVTIEVDPGGEGNWMKYKSVDVQKGETFEFDFPASFQARWIRFKTDTDCTATAWLSYS